MAITKRTQEIKLRVAAKRMFKAMVTQSHTILLPDAIKGIEILEGDGGAGTVRQTNFADGTYIKHKIELIDTETFVSKYILIEGPMLGTKLESIHYEQNFEDSSDGGCIMKILSEYHTKGDEVLGDEDIETRNIQTLAFYTLTESYLLANPNLCA